MRADLREVPPAPVRGLRLSAKAIRTSRGTATRLPVRRRRGIAVLVVQSEPAIPFELRKRGWAAGVNKSFNTPALRLAIGAEPGGRSDLRRQSARPARGATFCFIKPICPSGTTIQARETGQTPMPYLPDAYVHCGEDGESMRFRALIIR
jgi:hypothetical protein